MTLPRESVAVATSRIPSLDGLRAIAVLVVFVGHSQLAPGIWPGHVGVTIFFFLSGFLITSLLRREHAHAGSISLSRFYLRRALRILPPAYLAIAAAVAVGMLGIVESDTTWPGVAAEMLSYTNYYIVVVGREGLPPDTTQFWSLGVEEHYYLIIPALVLLLLRRRLSVRTVGWILLGLGMVIPLWRIYLGLTGASFDRLYVSSDTRIDSLLFGSAMALLFNPSTDDLRRLPPRLRHRLAGWGAAVAAIVLSASAVVPSLEFRLSIADVIQCACLAVIFISVISHADSRIATLLNHPIVERIGVLSFSIYLFHRLALAVASEFIAMPVVSDLVAFAATLLIAQVVYWSVEKPISRLRRKLEAPR